MPPATEEPYTMASSMTMMMIDKIYEFSAPCFFDFIKDETDDDKINAELRSPSRVSATNNEEAAAKVAAANADSGAPTMMTNRYPANINKQKDLINLLGATYAIVLFLAASNASAVQSVVAVEQHECTQGFLMHFLKWLLNPRNKALLESWKKSGSYSIRFK
ncbi:uncharacterized protein LOC133741992 isoform X2 [Rosa rugosa]|uniref:uncharacterized protein LOC133741992 isoform X2 n=1 Tax=Rosa rugosa TaxID=74645 RepID=UPI002B40ABD5|nr:uncharacterized protein LOC133741992 isoform X2 [Rosa rugosa]